MTLTEELNKQLKSENDEIREDAEKVIKVVDKLKELNNGHVWQSQFTPLVYTLYEGKYPHGSTRYKLKPMGEVFLKGMYK